VCVRVLIHFICCDPNTNTNPTSHHLHQKKVVEARIVHDKDTGRTAGYAYVSFATKEEAGAFFF
jgi:RNA recognition motif-containing protein